TLCCWPATLTLTRPGASAFHCARRCRVFARDTLRLGTAMVELSYRGVPRRRPRPTTATQDNRSVPPAPNNARTGTDAADRPRRPGSSPVRLTRYRQSGLTYRLV